MDEVQPRGGVPGNLKGSNSKDVAKLGGPSHWLPKSNVYVCEIEEGRVFWVPAWNKNNCSIYILISKYNMQYKPQKTVDNINI
jgi:hypothetical protein